MFTLSFHTNNDQFVQYPLQQCKDILEKIIQQLSKGNECGDIVDINGNIIGGYGYSNRPKQFLVVASPSDYHSAERMPRKQLERKLGKPLELIAWLDSCESVNEIGAVYEHNSDYVIVFLGE